MHAEMGVGKQLLTDLTVRWMDRRDIPAVEAIGRACYHLRPWVHPMDACALGDFLHGRSNAHVVATAKDPFNSNHEFICGYMLYSLGRREIELIDLSVWPEYQRLGIGSMLLRRLIGKLNDRRREIRCLCSDRETGTHLFLRSNGFAATRVYHDDELDNDYSFDLYEFVYPFPTNQL